MKKLYCPECGEYLEGGDGTMQDCLCGWKQPKELEEEDVEYDITEIETDKCIIRSIDKTEIDKVARNLDSPYLYHIGKDEFGEYVFTNLEEYIADNFEINV